MEERILYLNCLSGISGDMAIGALLDLGLDREAFQRELEKVKVGGYKLKIEKNQKNGITGTDFDVIIEDPGEPHPDPSKGKQPGHHHDQDHNHHHHGARHHDQDHNHHHHGVHAYDHGHDQNHLEGPSHEGRGHHHRNLQDIEKLIEESLLAEPVKKMSKEIFMHVAKAEAKIHDKPIDQVHFHEVGAIDSIVDIIGVSILVHQLNPDRILASPLHIGTGFVKCAHGKIPVPAPATLEILKGIPVYSTGIRSELVTPTGAAIVKALADEFIDIPMMEIEKIGYGLGTKDLEITNMLRVLYGKKKRSSGIN